MVTKLWNDANLKNYSNAADRNTCPRPSQTPLLLSIVMCQTQQQKIRSFDQREYFIKDIHLLRKL